MPAPLRLPPLLTYTLARVAAAMAPAGAPWWIISSAAVALHDADPGSVGDVDLLVGHDDAAWLLLALGLPVVSGAPTERFRSATFGTWRAPPLDVDIMAGFEVRDAGGWHAVSPQTRVPVAVGTATLYVPARAELAALLRRFGRPKDVARAAVLEAARAA